MIVVFLGGRLENTLEKGYFRKSTFHSCRPCERRRYPSRLSWHFLNYHDDQASCLAVFDCPKNIDIQCPSHVKKLKAGQEFKTNGLKIMNFKSRNKEKCI